MLYPQPIDENFLAVGIENVKAPLRMAKMIKSNWQSNDFINTLLVWKRSRIS
jgi:hypothetical protein